MRGLERPFTDGLCVQKLPDMADRQPPAPFRTHVNRRTHTCEHCYDTKYFYAMQAFFTDFINFFMNIFIASVLYSLYIYFYVMPIATQTSSKQSISKKKKLKHRISNNLHIIYVIYDKKEGSYLSADCPFAVNQQYFRKNDTRVSETFLNWCVKIYMEQVFYDGCYFSLPIFSDFPQIIIKIGLVFRASLYKFQRQV